jgi:hypothetical protein
MGLLKIILLFASMVVMGGAVATSSASAACPSPCLPTVLMLPGEPQGIVHSQSDDPNNGILSHLANSAGTELEGKGFLASESFTNLRDASDGTYLTLFLEITEPKEASKCNTAGDRTGEVLLPTNLFLLVGLVGGGVGSLHLLSEFTIKCGILSIKVKGSVLSSVTAGVNEEAEANSNKIKSMLHCKSESTGEPELSKYLNEKAEETLIPTLLLNVGAGFLKSCLEIPRTITALPSEMTELME